jgi:hypothetical protein
MRASSLRSSSSILFTYRDGKEKRKPFGVSFASAAGGKIAFSTHCPSPLIQVTGVEGSDKHIAKTAY